MHAEGEVRAGKPQRRAIGAQTIAELMLLVAGAGLGISLITPDVREGSARWVEIWLLPIVAILGGFSLVGPPLLLWHRRRDRRPWRPGRVLWFTQGMASWLLWPPVVYSRLQGRKFGDTTSGLCYYYGTPLVAIYVTSALLAGGWIRRRRPRARPLDWRDRFGLILALAWACIGFYILSIYYRDDFRR